MSTGDVSDNDVSAGDVSEGNADGESGLVADELPVNVAEDAADNIASGTYYGLDWVIDANGLLTISGTYSYASGTGTKWNTNNATHIVSVKVTAKDVTQTIEWFQNCTNLVNVDFSEFDTGKVEKMSGMFAGCSSLKELDLSNFDTSNVTTMYRMFSECIALESLDISSFNTAKVNEMSSMFAYCRALTSLDLSHFDTTQVMYMNYMFMSCSALQTLNLSGFDMSQVIRAPLMLEGCNALDELYTPKNVTIDIELPVGLQDDNHTLYTSLPKATTTSLYLVGFMAYGEFYGARWYLTEGGKLTITGTCVAHSYGTAPWLDYKSEIKSVVADAVDVENTDDWFEDCVNLESVDLSQLDNSLVTDMSGMFRNCSSLTELDLSNFDTSQVEDMSYMFDGCSALQTLDVSHFDTSKVTDMESMFNNCANLTSLDFSMMDTGKLKDTDAMLDGCTGLEEVYCLKNLTSETAVVLPVELKDLAGKNYTSMPVGSSESVLLMTPLEEGGYCGMNWMITPGGTLVIYGTYGAAADTDTFWIDSENAGKITSAKVTASGVTNTFKWFFKLTNLESVDLSEFDSSKITNMGYMFYNCSSLKELDLGKFSTDAATSMYAMFCGCKALTALDLSGFNTSKVTNMGAMFQNCSSLTTLDLRSFNTSNVTDMKVMFYECSGLTELVLNPDTFVTAKVTNMRQMFYNCPALQTVDVSGFDTSQVTDMYAMFYNCRSLTTLDVSKFVTNKVTNMSYMFYYCNALTTLDVSGFDTANVTTMDNMFNTCSKVTVLDVSKFKTSKVTAMDRMFYGCSQLTELDLSSFDFAGLTSAEGILGGCNSLSYIKTPRNLNIIIALTKELEDKERNIYTSLPKGLEESIVLTHVIYRIATVEDQTYTGKAIKPVVTVYRGDRVLTLGVDYTVSYKNNKNAADKKDKKAPTITVKGKNNYMGTLTATFTIKAKKLTEENTTAAPTIVAQNGKVQTFKSSVTLDGKKLKAKKDYEITYPDKKTGAYQKPGKYKVTIKGIGNYAGQITTQLIVLAENQIQASKLKVGKIAACGYVEGIPATPTPEVSYKGAVLEFGKDYAIEYRNNDKVGKATLIIKGLENVKGTYVTGSVTKTFTIKGTDLKKVKIEYDDSAIYTGQEICPTVTLTNGEVTLRPDIDYTVEYTKNVNVGKGTITIKGCGGYTGTIKKTFQILADETIGDKLKVSFAGGEAAAYYSQKGAKPEIFVKLDKVVLKPGKDSPFLIRTTRRLQTVRLIRHLQSPSRARGTISLPRPFLLPLLRVL